MIDIITIIGTAATIAGVTWYLARRLSQIDARLGALDPFFEYVEKSFGILTGAMVKKDLIAQDEAKEIVKGVSFSQIWHTLKEAGANPITSEELRRLKAYVKRVQDGDFLSPKEAKDFERLSQLIAEEKRGDEGARWLLMLAAFLVGWWIGSSRE